MRCRHKERRLVGRRLFLCALLEAASRDRGHVPDLLCDINKAEPLTAVLEKRPGFLVHEAAADAHPGEVSDQHPDLFRGILC